MISTEKTPTIPTDQECQRPRWRRLLVGLAVALPLGFALAWAGTYALNAWSAYAGYSKYKPQEGDIVFQSLPHGPVVWAIEGGTKSPYSHCGIVGSRDGQWIVYEAYRGVSATPLKTFLLRGRGGGFAVYRLREECRAHIPETLRCCEKYLGRPYDIRYRMDDEKIYCSELVFKAFRDATDGQQLGALVKFGDMNWGPYETLTPESGKRKAKDPAAYPLTPRVFDLTDGCGSLMHGSIRQDRGPGTPLYRCARYMKSPRFCHHNNVNAEALLQFTLKTIATRVKRAGGAEKIRAALVARAKAAAGNPKAKSPEDALRSQIQAKVERLRQQVEQAPRRILEAEDEDVRAMMHAALRDLRAELADQEKALLEVNARTPHRPDTFDIDAEIQKALDVIERIETVCGDPVAREQVPRLLSDLGVRIGLTFREGRAEKNRKVRRLQGGIIAFGNRPLPCVLRNGAGRPMVGGLAPEAGEHAHDGGCDHGHHDAQPDKALRQAGDKKTLSNAKGKSTGARGGPRGATPHSLVDSKPPRQPPETGRLSKVSRGDRI